MIIKKGCRMTGRVFEQVFIPSFKYFSAHKAKKVAEKILATLDAETVTMQLVRNYNHMQSIKKQPFSVKEYIAKNSFAVSVEKTIERLIQISKSPKESLSLCCDAGIDVFIHQEMIYAVPLTTFIEEYTLPKKVEDFSFSPDEITSDWSLRKETWQKLYKNGRMRMEIINISKGTGIDMIKEHLTKNPIAENIKPTEPVDLNNEDSAESQAA